MGVFRMDRRSRRRYALGAVALAIAGGSVFALSGIGNAAPPPASSRIPGCSLGDQVYALTRTRLAGPLADESGRGTPGAALSSFLAAHYPRLDASAFAKSYQAADRVQFELRDAGRTRIFVDVDTFTGTWSIAEMSACNATLVSAKGEAR